ncbi:MULTISPECIES: heparinase II/III domain-containing protein [Mumia]|uniref:heparinase II/III domain-containing protein n=1 Tax=Mumia TaxID=1546255 RepID=UPI001421B2CB|nr:MULTISPECIES: heparinase II/III family protein [unclassified Mumia]QMW66632.1 heparinase II/III family protein [Mumia sp. ZJ1417]
MPSPRRLLRTRRVPALRRGVGAAVAAALSLSGIVAVQTAVAPAPASAAAGYDAICENMHTLGSLTRADVGRARAIMNGTVDMGQYGTMALAANPSWKPQSGLDTAGDRYIHSLHWALPLLKTGLALADAEGQAMQRRFVDLMVDWVRDNPVKKRTYWQNHPQYLGFRIGTFVCMNRLASSPTHRSWAAGQLRVELKKALSYGTSGNNTTMNLKLTAFAGARQAGTEAQRTTLRNQTVLVARRLAHDDGSDLEGAPGYGLYLGTIMHRAYNVLSRYGATSSAAKIASMLNARGSFYAHASRPDRYLETIGDTHLQRIPSGVFADTSEAEWVRTSGSSGRKPAAVYKRYAGGYAFGRSGWVAGTDTTSTFYSVRTADRYALPSHRHADTTAMTWYADGVDWVADPGPYAYNGSSLRAAVMRRNAHSALVAPGTPNRAVYGSVKAASSAGGVDRTCVYDPGYLASSGFELARCVYYLRAIDAVVVEDLVRSTRSSGTVQQQWVLPSGVTPRASGHTVALTSPDLTGVTRSARLLTGGAPRVSAGSTTTGVLGQSYGKSTRGTVVRVPVSVRTGKTARMVTVLTSSGSPGYARTTVKGHKALRVWVNGRSQTITTSVNEFARLAAKVSFARSKAKVRVGQKVKFSARVTSLGLPAKRAKVVLQEWRKGKWRKVRTLRTKANGTVSTKVKMTSKGKKRYRIVVRAKSGSHGWKPVASPLRTVKVIKKKR